MPGESHEQSSREYPFHLGSLKCKGLTILFDPAPRPTPVFENQRSIDPRCCCDPVASKTDRSQF